MVAPWEDPAAVPTAPVLGNTPPGTLLCLRGSVSPRGGGEPRVPSRTIRATPEGWDRAVVGYRGGRRSGPSRALCRHWSPAWGWGRAGEGRQEGNRQLSLLCWSGLGVPEVRFPRPSSSCATAALAAALRPALGLPCRPGQEGWGWPWAPAWSLIPPPHPLGTIPIPGGSWAGLEGAQCPGWAAPLSPVTLQGLCSAAPVPPLTAVSRPGTRPCVASGSAGSAGRRAAPIGSPGPSPAGLSSTSPTSGRSTRSGASSGRCGGFPW